MTPITFKLPEIVEKELGLIRPTQDRIQGLSALFTPVFDWQTSSLQTLKKDLEEIAPWLEIKSPTLADVNKLPILDGVIRALKSKSSKTNKERMEFTGKFDAIKKRLMVPENEYEDAAKKLAPIYISIKKVEDAEKQRIADINAELTRFSVLMESKFNQEVTNCKVAIQSKVTEFLSESFDIGLDESDIIDFLKTKPEFNDKNNYIYSYSKIDMSSFIEVESKLIIFNNVFGKWDRVALNGYMVESCSNAFINYDAKKNDFNQAIKNRVEDQHLAQNAIEEDQEVADVIVQLDVKSDSVPGVQQFYAQTKDLREVFEVDMVHNISSMSIIHKAFFMNKEELMMLWSGKDCWNIDVNTMASLLARKKNEDSAFQPDKVVFKIVNKM